MLVANPPLTSFVKTTEKPKSGLDQTQTLARSVKACRAAIHFTTHPLHYTDNDLSETP